MIVVLISLAIWLGLIAFWGGFPRGFWRADQRLGQPPEPQAWPDVTAVIPARNEAATIGEVLRAHAASDYPGQLEIILIDDSSDDGTGEIARAVDGARPIRVVEAPPIEPGWTGKLWAMHCGIAEAGSAPFLLLTDADILHAPDTLRRLVAKAQADRRAMVSLMARLDARGLWGGLLIPAFVFFFQKLYPFPWVNDPARRMAGAAGGCVLLRTEALRDIGGIAAIRGALIDDCTLAARVQQAGHRIWLGLARDAVISLRDNRALGSVWTMVARTAFTQLRYSAVLLAGSTLGMVLLYLAAPVGVAVGLALGDWQLALAGGGAWAAMSVAYRPTARLYGMPPWHCLSLPFAALLYMLMTLDSARRHWAGRGGAWKGRVYPAAP